MPTKGQMMQLYTSPTTPFGRKISVQVRESGLTEQVEEVVVAGTPLDPGTMPVQLNPLGRIPCLTTNQGALYDSRVISRYLDEIMGRRALSQRCRALAGAGAGSYR